METALFLALAAASRGKRGLFCQTLSEVGGAADKNGMAVGIVLFALNALLSLAIVLRERGDDPRLAGDKLLYRS